jgi:tetraacyldisaccharide 4'-kinase
MLILRILLIPITLLYGAAIYVRNFLFDIGIKKSTSFSRAVICIGNLTVGGTGKTPHTEHLINLLKDDFNVATLSRGYKRKTKGFILASSSSTASDIGDEPMQMLTKFPGISVAVDEQRVRGVETLLQQKPNTNVILLDDAFQHRYVKPGFSILLTDYNNLIYKDFFLPTGTLRDSFAQRKRASLVLVTKCPANLHSNEQLKIIKKLKLKPNQQVFFTTYRYGSLKPIFESGTKPGKPITVTALAGIANPKPFFRHLKANYSIINTIQLPDHYRFTEKKIRAIFESFSSLRKDTTHIVITTEKDAARIKEFINLPDAIKSAFFYIPIEVEFLDDKENEYNSKILKYVGKSKRNNSLH